MTDIRDQIADEVFRYITQYIETRGFAPSLREIGKHCHISYTTVPRYLDRLEMRGLISREIGLPRSISLRSN